jgi:uncharacterized membrane protein YkvA (DUF1232 family)
MSAETRRRTALTAFIRAFMPGTPGIGPRLAALPRMLKASIKREYDGGKRLLLMAGAALYIVSPIDLVPEAIFLAFGLIDDAFVAAWLVGALLSETERFLEWELSQGRGPSVINAEVITR